MLILLLFYYFIIRYFYTNNNNYIFFKLKKNINLNVNQIVDLPIYYINLDSSYERFFSFNSQVNKCNIPQNQIKKISAIDGKILDLSSLTNKIITKNQNTLLIACLLSHIKAIQTAYNDLCEYAIIMEDDCNFEYIQYQNYKLSDIANLYGEFYNVIQLALMATEKTNKKLRMTQTFIKPGYRDSCAAYIINRKGMKNVLNAFSNKNMELNVADITIYEFAQKCCHLTKPYFTYHYSKKLSTTLIESNSKNKYEDDSKLFWDKYYKIKIE